mgnify:CR=1 FL=1
MERIDSYPFYVEPFHVDFTGRIFLGVLGNHLLNAAGNHSQRRGWGIGALNETKHTWVLSRLSIEMTEMPRQYEHCEVRTWVESVMRLFTNRNFSIHRADGTPLGYARSVWHNREIVHGTLMYDVDIDTLTEALNVEGSSKLNLKGVSSVRSRVTNVRDYLPQFASLDELQAALKAILSAMVCPPATQTCPPATSNHQQAVKLSLSPAEQTAVDSLAASKFASHGWIYKL